MDQEAYVMVMGKLVTISLSNFIKCEEIGEYELEISHYEKDFYGKWDVVKTRFPIYPDNKHMLRLKDWPPTTQFTGCGSKLTKLEPDLG